LCPSNQSILIVGQNQICISVRTADVERVDHGVNDYFVAIDVRQFDSKILQLFELVLNGRTGYFSEVRFPKFDAILNKFRIPNRRFFR